MKATQKMIWRYGKNGYYILHNPSTTLLIYNRLEEFKEKFWWWSLKIIDKMLNFFTQNGIGKNKTKTKFKITQFVFFSFRSLIYRLAFVDWALRVLKDLHRQARRGRVLAWYRLKSGATPSILKTGRIAAMCCLLILLKWTFEW